MAEYFGRVKLLVYIGRMAITWKDSFSVGVKEIDDQHKLFVDVLGKMENVLLSGNADRNTVLELVDSLEEYVDLHFNTEEFYFKKFNYIGAPEHLIAHNQFREKASQEIAKIKSGESLTLDLVNYLESWLANHIMDMDQKYAECFAENGLK